MSKPLDARNTEWRQIDIYWEDGTRTSFYRQDIERLTRASNMLRDLHSALTIAEELLSLSGKVKA